MRRKSHSLFRAAVLMLVSASWLRAQSSGLQGRLPPCPSAPHCVCSQDGNPKRRVEPLSFSDEAPAAWARLKAALKSIRRLRIVEEKDSYLHAVATSCLVRFKDDVEFLLDGSEKKIHVRSCSRVGYYDFGVNRRRVERLRRLVDKQ